MSERHFAIKLRRSGGGRLPDQRATLAGLGVTRFGKTVYLKDTPAVRGMLYKVVHLIDVETQDGPPPPGTRAKARQAVNA
jgi:large subunit ribosomal protein L30